MTPEHTKNAVVPTRYAYLNLSVPRYDHVSTLDLREPANRSPLEELLEHGRLPLSESDPVMAAISDRRMTSGLALDDGLAQIKSRIDIYRQHLDALHEAQSNARNAARSWWDWTYSVDAGRNRELEQTLRDLDQNIHSERLALWRDVSRLRQALPAWAQEYLSAYRRDQILHEDDQMYGGGHT